MRILAHSMWIVTFLLFVLQTVLLIAGVSDWGFWVINLISVLFTAYSAWSILEDY